jgi:hypothetical protein
MVFREILKALHYFFSSMVVRVLSTYYVTAALQLIPICRPTKGGMGHKPRGGDSGSTQVNLQALEEK